ncbi:unnamed protein product [Parascedosporium putredinis]|uniref:Amino acid transporter n=1 Tax=Parascedosporium putredinis TaxID=1442378 RepID=A0A9P1MA45_9PEZI|nr:unnamed protein product [Parascedosporium putredinis]CAI7993279.1 unnamed protein product [Parascedosporium putredinis]
MRRIETTNLTNRPGFGQQPCSSSGKPPVMSKSEKLTATDSPTRESDMETIPVGTAQVEKRFNFWTAFSVAVCTSGAWEGWTASIAQGISGGGSVGLVWGWVFVSVGIVCMACALAEFVSMWPSSGGQYVWSANLASPKHSRFLSWVTAWCGLAGTWLAALSCGMGIAVQTQSYVMVNRDYEPKTWHAFVVMSPLIHGPLGTCFIMY